METFRVLIVEGDAELLHTCARTLESEGYEVFRATTAAEGLRAAAESHPHLIFLDLTLPDASGIEICQRLKAEPEQRQTFIVILSDLDSSAESQVEAVEAGADGYLKKPLEPESFKAHARAFLRIRQNEEDLRQSERRYRQQAEDLLAANRRLEEYNRLKAEFVANMSHELRTPLTAIIGFAQLAKIKQDLNGLPPFVSDAFDRILRNGQHLLALINDVLDVSKIEAGRMKIHGEHVNLVEVVQDAFSELQSLAQRKGIEYRLRIPEELPLAYTDPLRLRQIVVNLLSNAVKFTARGTVEVALTRAVDHDKFRLVVTDTGIGIEEKWLDVIFERFRQADGSMTRRVGGVGLGLSIVRQIVNLLGGKIEVASKAGAGSTFTVTLPMHLRAQTPEREIVEAQEEAASSTVESVGIEAADRRESGEDDDGLKPLILVVEDDPDAAALLSATIERAGYRVSTASDGADALSLARTLNPVAVTLDVMMPGMDGWRVLKTMKADRHLSRIPVIVCSIVDNRPLGYSLGASDYLVKPVEPGKLIETLDKISVRERSAEDAYVLVVDDEHGVRELLVTALKHVGYNTRNAASGETALRMIEQSVPSAVLCDLIMPNGMSGFELIARLRSEERTAHLPVILVTGKDLTDDDRRFIAGQIADVIRKGELMMSDIEAHLRETLEKVGVRPTDG